MNMGQHGQTGQDTQPTNQIRLSNELTFPGCTQCTPEEELQQFQFYFRPGDNILSRCDVSDARIPTDWVALCTPAITHYNLYN